MTREEAIEYWEQFNDEIDDLYDACSDADRDVLVKQREIAEYTISALRQQEHFCDVTKKVEPLTLDELRKMDGEPVWVQFLHNKIGYWYLIDCHNSEFIRFYRSGFFIIGEYSKNFLAYRRKPEED